MSYIQHLLIRDSVAIYSYTVLVSDSVVIMSRMFGSTYHNSKLLVSKQDFLEFNMNYLKSTSGIIPTHDIAFSNPHSV